MKSLNKIGMVAAFAFVFALGLSVTGCSKSEQSQSAQPTKYTCSMHPDVVQDKAGKCPKCGMDLVEKR